MANMKQPRFKMCRRLGLNVVGHPKAMDRAKRGTSRADKKLSNYGLQLLEKQRLRAYYGVLEKQFRNVVDKAMKQPGIAGDNIVRMLEIRLDNIVYRSGFASSIRQARQMVVHGHIRVNGKKVDRPSYQLSVGDVVALKDKSKDVELFKTNFDTCNTALSYLERHEDDMETVLVAMPQRDEVPIEIQDHLVVEFYSNK